MSNYFINQKNNNVIIGDVKNLTEFSSENVSVNVGGATINVVGQKLVLARFNENEIEIAGKVENVETINTRKRSV